MNKPHPVLEFLHRAWADHIGQGSASMPAPEVNNEDDADERKEPGEPAHDEEEPESGSEEVIEGSPGMMALIRMLARRDNNHAY